MTIQFKTIPAIQEIRTASNLNFSRLTQLMQEAAECWQGVLWAIERIKGRLS